MQRNIIKTMKRKTLTIHMSKMYQYLDIINSSKKPLNMLRLKMFTRFSLAFFILLPFSCSKQEDLAGRELWESLNISSYSMTQQISCYCPEEFISPKFIIVENNQIKLINGFSPDKTLGYESFYTIDQIFEFIDSKLDDDPEFHDIDYSSDYGYPNYLFFDMSRMIADEEISYYIKDLKPLK